MSLTAIPIYAPGDTITSAWANILRGNFDALDSRTGGDPAAADKWLVSSGATAAAWVARLAAVLAAIGYTPANAAGQAFTGDVTTSGNLGAGGAVSGASGNFVGQVAGGQFSGGSSAGGVLSLLQLIVGLTGISTTGPISPASYAGGSSAAGTPSVLGLNVGTSGIVIVGGPFTGVTGRFTADLTVEQQIVSELDNGVSPTFSIPAAQANVTVPNLKAAKAATADNGVPSGAVVWFETLAELTAAGAGWARYTAGDGRLLIGAGTTFSQTFAEATNYGANWTPAISLGVNAGSLDVAGSTDAAPTVTNAYTAGTASAAGLGHVHGSSGLSISGVPNLSGETTAWLPPARAGIWGRKV